MAGPAVRDRILTRRVAHAMMSPAAVLTAGAGLVAGLVAGLPAAATATLGILGWSTPVATAALRGTAGPGDPVDPFTLQEPWHTPVRNALASRARVRERADRARPGPLRDHLHDIAGRIDTAVAEAWRMARRGQDLGEARSAVDTDHLDRQITDLERSLAADPRDHRLAAALEARQGQRATADRMDRAIADTHAQLRLLDARLDEVVMRAAELSASTGDDTADTGGGTALSRLSGDVDDLVTEMEAVRRALDETHGTAGDLPTGDRE